MVVCVYLFSYPVCVVTLCRRLPLQFVVKSPYDGSHEYLNFLESVSLVNLIAVGDEDGYQPCFSLQRPRDVAIQSRSGVVCRELV
jgi:hypothetical protein